MTPSRSPTPHPSQRDAIPPPSYAAFLFFFLSVRAPPEISPLPHPAALPISALRTRAGEPCNDSHETRPPHRRRGTGRPRDRHHPRRHTGRGRRRRCCRAASFGEDGGGR